jgi:actin-related protein 4
MHKELLRNVLLVGGLACLEGLPERLEGELLRAAQTSEVASIRNYSNKLGLLVGTTQERRHGAWMGASILGSMGSHHELWMSRAEYDEYGAQLIGRKGMQYAW